MEKIKVMMMLSQLNAGGIQKLTIDLASQLNNDEFDVSILCLMPRNGGLFEKTAEEYGIKVFYLNKRSGMDFSVIPKIFKTLKKYHPDIIHANQRTLTYAMLPIIASGIKKVIYTVHNLADQDAKGLHQKIIKAAHNIFGVTLVAISDLCKRSISDVYHIDEKKIPCIYNGVDINFFASPTENIKKDIDFIAVGRMSSQKNYLMMLKAFKQVQSIYPDAKLTILGDGEKRSEIETFCEENHLSNNVNMPGNVSNVREYMWRSKVFLMSSDFEGLPITVLEAMAAGLPIVATKAGGIVDIVEDNGNGFLVNIGDEEGLAKAMIECLQNDGKMKSYADHSKALSQKYSIEHCANEYMKVYHSL